MNIYGLGLKRWNESELSDEEVFARSMEHPSLFAVILDRYQAAFLRKAENIIKDSDRAEDIVQEAFVKIYRRAETFTSEGEGSFKSWAYKVLVNTAFTHYDKLKGRGTVVLSPELAEVLPDESEEDRRAGKEMRDYISSVLVKMPANLSEMLKKFFLEGKSQEEIARESGLSVGAVKVRIYRAKEHFRRIASDIPW